MQAAILITITAFRGICGSNIFSPLSRCNFGILEYTHGAATRTSRI